MQQQKMEAFPWSRVFEQSIWAIAPLGVLIQLILFAQSPTRTALIWVALCVYLLLAAMRSEQEAYQRAFSSLVLVPLYFLLVLVFQTSVLPFPLALALPWALIALVCATRLQPHTLAGISAFGEPVRLPLQLAIGAAGVLAALLAAFLLPGLLPSNVAWGHVAAVTFAALASEFLLRGSLFAALLPVMGWWAILASALLSAALFIPQGWQLALLAAVLGLLSGWVVYRTRAFAGVVLAQGVGNLALLLYLVSTAH